MSSGTPISLSSAMSSGTPISSVAPRKKIPILTETVEMFKTLFSTGSPPKPEEAKKGKEKKAKDEPETSSPVKPEEAKDEPETSSPVKPEEAKDKPTPPDALFDAYVDEAKEEAKEEVKIEESTDDDDDDDLEYDETRMRKFIYDQRMDRPTIIDYIPGFFSKYKKTFHGWLEDPLIDLAISQTPMDIDEMTDHLVNNLGIDNIRQIVHDHFESGKKHLMGWNENDLKPLIDHLLNTATLKARRCKRKTRSRYFD
jgi:hypothetical protein